MTTATAVEVEKRKGARGRNIEAFFAAGCAAALVVLGTSQVQAASWPSAKYRSNPVGFFTEVLGITPWDKQVEIIEAVRDNGRVAVRSGNKAGKSTSCAGLALWYWASFEDARVVLTATTDRQVNGIIWRELKRMLAHHGWCVACKAKNRALQADGRATIPRPCPHSQLITDQPGGLARTGLKAADFREILGYTASEAEALAGVSGTNILYIVDEASGVDDEIFDAIEGNRAGGGGAKLVMISNPTRTSGAFYEAFHSKSSGYRTVHINSEENVNCRAGRVVIPGIADPEWIATTRRELGADSAFYRIRVRGEFVYDDQLRVISVHDITQATTRWQDTPAEGRLCIGLDPAGDGEGDETVFAVRRGLKVLHLLAVTKLNADGILSNLLGLLKDHRQVEEIPIVALDVEGDIGTRVRDRLRAYLNDNDTAFQLLQVKASAGATRQPQNFDRTRDELWGNVRDWMREGGAIPDDAKLVKELHAPEWYRLVSGRAKVTSKQDLRKTLGRSPDRADAVCLAVWQRTDLPADPTPPRGGGSSSPDPDFAPLDPYSGVSTWGST